MKNRQIAIGFLLWAAAAVGAVVAVWQRLPGQRSSPVELLSEVSQWIGGRQSTFSATSPSWIQLAVGDPVLMRLEDGTYRQVGVVSDTLTGMIKPIWTKRAVVTIYDKATAGSSQGFQLTYYGTPQSLNWVASTIIPPERRKQIVQLLTVEWEKQREEVIRGLLPLVQDGLRTAIEAIEAELPEIVESHRSEFVQLGERYQAEIMQKQIVPLFEDQILPIVLEEARPVASEIGRGLWNRVSLWSFTWRYVYDVSPLPRRQAVQTEFDRFLREEAIPEIQSRMPALIQLGERIMERISKDPAVRQTVRASLKTVASDSRLHEIVWNIVRDAIVENEVLRTSMADYMRSEPVRSLLRTASSRFEPTARAIGDLIIGSRDQGITPEFARVLRAQILLKDRHWLILTPASGASEQSGLRIVPGTDPMMFPIILQETKPSPLSPVQ